MNSHQRRKERRRYKRMTFNVDVVDYNQNYSIRDFMNVWTAQINKNNFFPPDVVEQMLEQSSSKEGNVVKAKIVGVVNEDGSTERFDKPLPEIIELQLMNIKDPTIVPLVDPMVKLVVSFDYDKYQETHSKTDPSV